MTFLFGVGKGEGAGGEDDISIIYACIKSNIHSNNVTLHYTGSKFLQSGLEGNKYNDKSLTMQASTMQSIMQPSRILR